MAARHKHRRLTRMQERCARFNAQHPIGTAIRVRDCTDPSVEVDMRVAGRGAVVLSGDSEAVYVTGPRGCVALSEVEWEDKAPKHDHLAFVREQGCVAAKATGAMRCLGIVAAHHHRTAANSGVGMKPPDTSTVGLCWRHHQLLHQMGRRTFEATFVLDLAAEAERLALLSASIDPNR